MYAYGCRRVVKRPAIHVASAYADAATTIKPPLVDLEADKTRGWRCGPTMSAEGNVLLRVLWWCMCTGMRDSR